MLPGVSTFNTGEGKCERPASGGSPGHTAHAGPPRQEDAPPAAPAPSRRGLVLCHLDGVPGATPIADRNTLYNCRPFSPRSAAIEEPPGPSGTHR
jgi:hypothetical protein